MHDLRGHLSESEVQEISRSVIVAKAVDECRQYADYQNFVRRSPSRYDNIGSKVARNLEVRKSVTRRSRKERANGGVASSEAKPFVWRYEDNYLGSGRSSKKQQKKRKSPSPVYMRYNPDDNVTPTFDEASYNRRSRSPTNNNLSSEWKRPYPQQQERLPIKKSY